MAAGEYEKIFMFLNDGTYVEGMNENDKRRIRKRTDMFSITEGKLYYKGGKSNKGENKLVITRDQKSSILKLCHIDNGCHMGMEKTFYKLSERYYWKGMSTDLKEYIQRCQQCQQTNKKVKTTPTELQPVPIPKSTWKKIGIDLIGPYTNSAGDPISTEGYRYVLTVIDYFSNYVEVFPLKRKQASEVSARLYDLFCRQGLPLELVSDNGGEFNSRLTASLQEQYGYKHILITPYHPQSNGRCERYNQTLKSMLNKTVEEKASEWQKFVPKCAFAYNTSKQASTKYSPFYLMYWRNPIIPNENQFGNTVNTFEPFKEINHIEIAKVAETMTNIQKEIVDEVTDNVSIQQERQKLQFDKKHNVENNSFKKGDLVLVKNMKKKKTLGMIKWLGPYTISDLPKLGTITLIDSNDKLIGKYRQNNIKRYTPPEPNCTMNEKSDNEELHEDDIIDENNNTENDMGDSIFITQSSYDDNNMSNENTFDLGIEDLCMPSPSPTKEKDTDEQQNKDDEVNESGPVCRPKRKLKDRRNSIYEYFTVLSKKSK